VARPGFTIVLDACDDVRTVRGALAAHRPGAGVITVHPTPGTQTLQALAHDILGALGDGTPPASAHAGLSSPEAAWRAATACVISSKIRHVAVLRAHLFAARRWSALTELQHASGANLTVFCHTATLPASISNALSSAAYTVTEDVEQALAALGADHRVPGDSPGPDAPDPPPQGELPFPTAPNCEMPHFRAAACQQLTAGQFERLDAQYRYGSATACVWITHQETYRESLAPPEAPDDTILPNYLHPRHIPEVNSFLSGAYGGAAAARWVFEGLLCLGRAKRSDLRPYPWPETHALRTFLATLVCDSRSIDVTLARVRGAQAGFLLHGLLLCLPPNLRERPGPGLTSFPLDAASVHTVRALLPNPVHAAAYAIAMLTGASYKRLYRLRIQDVAEHGATVNLDGPHIVPPSFRPVVHAAVHARRMVGARPDQLLLPRGRNGGWSIEALAACAQACGIDPAAFTKSLSTIEPDALTSLFDGTSPVQAPWHQRAQCWFVAHPLHGTPHIDDELGRLEASRP
jgi:hypothetical protein